MEAADVAKLVKSELGATTESTGGWDFGPYLVDPPQRATYRSTNGIPWTVWVVLRESEDGYIVAYDDDDGEVLLVTGGVVISSYNSLMDAINGL